MTVININEESEEKKNLIIHDIFDGVSAYCSGGFM